MFLQNLKKAFVWQHIRWLTAFLGLILVILGQFQLASNAITPGKSTGLGEWLNRTLHVDIPSVDNVLFGLLILLAGGVLIFLALRGSRSSLPDEPTFEAKPLSVSLLRKMWPLSLLGVILFFALLSQLNPENNSLLLPVLWVAAISTFAVMTFLWDRRRQTDLSPHLQQQDLIWLVALLTIGLVIGTYRLQGIPDQLMGDEGVFWTTARDIATGVFKPPIFSAGVYSFPILSSVWQGAVMRIFGITLWGWRFASVLAGVLTVIPLYLLARDLFNRRIAVLASVILVTNPYFLTFARLGYNNIQALFVSALAVYWLYIGLKRSSSFLLFLAGCAIGLSFYSYFAARGALLVAVIFVLLMWATKQLKFKAVLHAFILLGVGMILVAGPHFVYGFQQDALSMSYKTFESAFFNTYNGQLFYSDAELYRYVPPIRLGGNDLFFNPVIYLVLIARGLIRSLLVFQKAGIVTEHFIAFPLAGTIGAVFYLLGFGYVLKNIKQSRNQFIIIWFFVNIFALSALNTAPPRHTHMVAILPALALLCALGLDAVMRLLARASAWIGKHKNALVAALAALIGIGGVFEYFVVSPQKYYPEPEQIMSWAGLDSHGESFVYVYQDTAQEDFIPYGMSEILRDILFETVAFDNLAGESNVFEGDKKMIVFYPPELMDKMTPVLYAQWGNDLHREIFYNREGHPILIAGMNAPFTFERQRPFLSTLLDSFHSPAFDILLILLVASRGLGLFTPAIKMPCRPAWLARLIAWFNRPEETYQEEEVVEEETWWEAPPQAISEASLDEAPAWASELPPLKPSQRPGRLTGQFKSVRTPEGKDFYLKIHFPTIRFPWRRLPAGIELSLPAIQIPGSVLLIISVFLAMVAQYAISRQAFWVGILLYLAGAIGLIVWVRKHPKWRDVFTHQMRVSPRAEILLVSLLLLAAAFFRFYDLSQNVYGLEGDETKWTMQSWFSTILQVNQGDFATMHYQDLPVDFWLRSGFLRVFGLNFLSGRIESALLSLISVFFLYLLIRRLTASKPLAWLATLLYSFSFLELNLAHQALAETTPEVWIMAGLYFFVRAMQERKAWLFQLTGLLLALGMLTYDTFFPTSAAALLFLVGFAVFRIARKKDAIRTWLRALLLMAWPVVLVYFLFTHNYLQARFGYYLGSLASSGNAQTVIGWFHFVFGNIGQLLRTLFFRITWTDSLVNWNGPLISPLLLPFVVIGFIYNLWNIRRPYFALIPLWFLMNAVVSVSLGSVFPRVLYTCLAPLMIWAAMGLWTLLATLRAWLESLKLKAAAPVFALVLIGIIFFDYHTFTTSLSDPGDRQQRRELADLTAQSTGEVPKILFPYLRNENDTLELETNLILFSIAGERHTDLEAGDYFQQDEFAQALATLWHERQTGSLDLFFDKSAPSERAQRTDLLSVILRCYPGARLAMSGRFFDVYRFDAEALSQPRCYSSLSPTHLWPLPGSTSPAEEPVTLEWTTGDVNTTSYLLTVEKKKPGIYLIEAEEVFVGGGWYTSDRANDFSGTGFLQDSWQSEDTSYVFSVPENGRYRIWIRTYKRRVNDQQNFIEINGEKTEFATYQHPFNQWMWEDLGAYDLTKGSLPITLSRSYGQDEEYSVFIDSLLITALPVDSPDQVKLWENVLDTDEIRSPLSRYTLPGSLPAGEYRWKVRIFDGDRLVDPTGARGLESQYATFTLEP